MEHEVYGLERGALKFNRDTECLSLSRSLSGESKEKIIVILLL